MANYAVGDIQGCYTGLCRLLEKVNFDPAADCLWSVGDMVNRGPDSLQTLRFLISLGDSFKAVLGNHDLHLLALANGAQSDGQKRYLDQVLKAEDCTDLCHWLRQIPLVRLESFNTNTGVSRFLMVHAGVPPMWTLQQTLSLAAEVENALQGHAYKDYLQAMYGNEPTRWEEKLSGALRLRMITNYLTRMRFCTADGSLDLAIKTGPENAPPGFRPWFEWPQASPEVEILFGHWAALDGVTGISHIHALDTGYVWGRSMTLMRLEDRKRFRVQAD